MNVDLSNGLEYLVWVDIETTGVNHRVDRLLEIGAVITTMSWEFRQVGEPFERVLGLGDHRLQLVDPKVIAMHSANGLWADAQKSRLEYGQALAAMQKWFTEHAPEGATFYWAGRSLHFDLQWLLRGHHANLETERTFSHRRFDIRPILAFLTLSGVEFAMPEEKHRALPDVMADIELARTLIRALGRIEVPG
jgi:oligoribonuclease (3'-5' exoribonuclease)